MIYLFNTNAISNLVCKRQAIGNRNAGAAQKSQIRSCVLCCVIHNKASSSVYQLFKIREGRIDGLWRFHVDAGARAADRGATWSSRL